MSNYKISNKPVAVSKIKTAHRIIKTKIPSPSFVRFHKMLERYEPSVIHNQLPVMWDKAKDFRVWDKDGNCWIDFTSSIFVTNTGHSNPDILKAIRAQLDRPLLHSYNYTTEIKAKYLEKLIKFTPSFCEQAALFSSGSEAMEAAILVAKDYGRKIHKDKIGIISFQGAMHGVTAATSILKGNQTIIDTLGYTDPHVYRLPFPYTWEAEGKGYNWPARLEKDLITLKKNSMKLDNICAVVLEAFQGWGALFYPKDYIQSLVKLAKKHKILIIVDEIQGGFGRTGKMFAFEHYGIEPDLIAVGKGLSGSLPLSALIGRRKILNTNLDVLHSTHSGSPLSLVAGLANLEYIKENNLVQASAKKGEILFKRLRSIQKKFPTRISHVLGHGLLAAVIFKHPITSKPDGDFASRVCERAMQKGLLLVHTGRESIKIAPPLTIPEQALLEGLDVFEESINSLNINTQK